MAGVASCTVVGAEAVMAFNTICGHSSTYAAGAAERTAAAAGTPDGTAAGTAAGVAAGAARAGGIRQSGEAERRAQERVRARRAVA